MLSPLQYARNTLLLLLLLSPGAADYYKILGIKRSATPKEIKKAYRSKSLQYHPDKNREEDAAERFAEISRAYEVLTDDSLKDIYDRHGEAGLEQHEKGGGRGGGGGGGFEDIFSNFGFNQRGRGETKTPDVTMKLRLTLKQLYTGHTLDLEYVRQALCMNWQECMKNAQDCTGPGVKVRMQQLAPGFVQQVQTRDESCVARGKKWRPNCRACPNGQTEEEKLELTIDIPAGKRAGERVVFQGVADEKPGMDSGDLIFVIQEISDKDFTRRGDHLYMNIEIPLVDALTGFQKEITHVDGSKFTIEVNTVTECDHTMRIPGKGMARRTRGKGDLYITFDVDFPETLTNSQKSQIRDILGSSGGSNEASSEL